MVSQLVYGNGDGIRPVFLIDSRACGDYASYIRRILVGLSGTAHASALVCPSIVNSASMLCPSVERIDHPALRLPIFFQQNRRILLERLARFKPTVIHAFYPGFAQPILANWLSHQLEIPYVLTFHRPAARWQRFEYPICQAAAMIAPSGPIAEQLAARWPALAERIERVHVGSFVEDTCRCFADDSRVPSLLAVGPLDSAERFEPLLKAVRHLVQEGTELMVVMIGSGRGEKHIRRLIRTQGLTGAVTVVPPMQPMRSILAGADIYLHLADTGLYDARLTEAMAVGLAVVGTPEAGSGLLVNGETAAFWDAADEHDIYACLKKCLGQRNETRQLALNGQARLRRHNSVSGMVDRLMQIYARTQREHKNAGQPAEPQAAAAE